MISQGQKASATPSTRKKVHWDWVWGYCFIAPQLIGIAVFYLYPLIYSFAMSFFDWDGITTPIFTGIHNYSMIFSNSESKREMLNTVIYTIGTVPLGLLLSIILANILNKKVIGKGFFRTVYFLPTVTMPVAIALVWRWLMNSKIGLINIAFDAVGLPKVGWINDPNVIMFSLIIISIWSLLGYNMVILLAGLQGISKSYFEAADVEGANGFVKFFKITIPLLSPTIFFLMIIMIMNALKAFDFIYIFSGASSSLGYGPLLTATRTMVFGIYEKGFQFMKMGYASAQAVILFLLIAVLTLIQFKFQDKWVYYD